MGIRKPSPLSTPSPMGRRRRFGRVAALGGVSLLWAIAAPGRQDVPTFGEAMDVQLVLIETVVTDASGDLVQDLTAADFRVFEDGAPVAIEHLSLVKPGGGGGDDRAPLPPGTASRQPLELAIFIDEVHVGAASRREMLREMAAELENGLEKGDRVTIALYDGNTRVLLPWTVDRKEIGAALASIETVSTARLVAENDWRETQQDLMDDASGEHGWSPCLHIAEYAQYYADRQEMKVRIALESFGGYLESLGGRPGRKAVLHVSDGIPARPGAEAWDYAQELCSGTGVAEGLPGANARYTREVDIYSHPHHTLDTTRLDTSLTWERLTARANAANVTIYTFQGGTGRASGVSAELATTLQSPTVAANLQANLQETLWLLADRTGGRASFAGSDIGLDMQRTLRELRGYYMISYAMPPTSRAAVRRVRVEVDRPNVEIRHRKLYQPRSPHDRVAQHLLGQLLYGAEAGHDSLALELVGAPQAATGGVKARFHVRVPLASLTLVERGDTRDGLFTVFIAHASADRASAVRSASVPVHLPASAPGAPPADFTWGVDMTLPPGRPRLAVAIHDELSGETAFVIREFTLGGGPR
jgi:VWFA-related protein